MLWAPDADALCTARRNDFSCASETSPGGRGSGCSVRGLTHEHATLLPVACTGSHEREGDWNLGPRVSGAER